MKNQMCSFFSVGCFILFPIQAETLLPLKKPVVLVSPANLPVKKNLPTQVKSELNDQQLKKIAEDITVEVWSDKFLASGIIISKKNNEYFVVTNAHVVQWVKPPFQIKTPDGILHKASIVESIDFADTDLRILKFQAKQSIYQLAKRGYLKNLKQGDKVFAAGFPLNLPQSVEEISPETNTSDDKMFTKNNDKQNHGVNNQIIIENREQKKETVDLSKLDNQELKLTEGKVVFVLNKALERGYQIGYTNEIQKGMSGGPVLNQAGELVAINGIHAHPIWVMDTYYEDKTLPNDDLQKAIPLYSWAIPVDRILSQSCPKDKVKQGLSRDPDNE